ncbi:hypothetical protein Dsin_001376 [Dipteronia sinensis]|uniref:Uncharacterized protein n=1 Tax=Dipteronia sinensis TaxID=43782 RepID=A0AAE0EK88_9ROSI|nr:hypothetical protein Dsin_001376 [Dipteronia sinensis]
MWRRNKKLMVANHRYNYNKQPRLMLTNSTSISGLFKIDSFSSLVVCDHQKVQETMDGGDDDDDDKYWSIREMDYHVNHFTLDEGKMKPIPTDVFHITLYLILIVGPTLNLNKYLASCMHHRTKSNDLLFLDFNPEIEKTLRQRRKETRNQANISHLGNVEARQDLENARSLRDFAVPTVDQNQSSIRRPTVAANNFEIKSTIIQMIQTTVQFKGLLHEDPNTHIENFLEICDTFKDNGVSDDAIQFRLFPLLNSLPLGSITTWEKLAQAFLNK